MGYDGRSSDPKRTGDPCGYFTIFVAFPSLAAPRVSMEIERSPFLMLQRGAAPRCGRSLLWNCLHLSFTSVSSTSRRAPP
ncbi:T. brucei spp.-specific protein [Trypanosoma brucei gambiense DAL972]|uniref:T. brucei spp.-specific protein n=2 Tax=Trypanosoma brucei TaxID=5691 RepID=D0A2M2_TRYB9|nr:T. brucei spp.-specific protein [Trypanosoma brucei gambiense DAL972]RHW69068.1 hypothetical protein DPX39_100055200 [Trypanosoma brucei equiperdum]CBH15516.1 T. brucei spp.-specific protein [Trypanosoma brucei gambiense DAL972]|eukprot:XP_011777780.1 T. brucei spp.-specific protein [Trypanosoma brucei gambiense DAL972]